MFGASKPVNREFYLAIGYEGISKNLFVALMDRMDVHLEAFGDSTERLPWLDADQG